MARRSKKQAAPAPKTPWGVWNIVAADGALITQHIGGQGEARRTAMCFGGSAEFAGPVVLDSFK